MVDKGIHYEDALREFDRRFIVEVVGKNAGNLTKAADTLGVHRNTLARKIKDLKIKPQPQARSTDPVLVNVDLALRINTGSGQVNAANTQATPAAPGSSGGAPAFALDVSALGGMYAGKITLIGTEAGVGVRNAGEIGASAGSVTVTDALPAAVTFVSATPTNATVTSSNVIWPDLGSLAANAATNLLITVTAPANTATLTNTATVGSPTVPSTLVEIANWPVEEVSSDWVAVDIGVYVPDIWSNRVACRSPGCAAACPWVAVDGAPYVRSVASG